MSLNYKGFPKCGVETVTDLKILHDVFYKRYKVICTIDEDKWITTKSGSHVLLGENGEIKAGMGGKFNGHNISKVKSNAKNLQSLPSVAKASEINFNELAIKTTVAKLEVSRRTLDHEEASIIDPQGNVIASFVGEEGSVNFTSSISQLENSTLTHNHPNGGTLSDIDVETFCDYNVYEIRASAPTGEVFSLKRGGGTVNPDMKYKYAAACIDAVEKARDIAAATVTRNGRLTSKGLIEYITIRNNEADRLSDEWLSVNSEKYGYIYTVERQG